MYGTIAPLLALLIFAAPAYSQAQSTPRYDHLQCHKIKDRFKFSAVVRLRALQEQFPPESGCKVLVKGKQFCIPVDKTVEESSAPGAVITGQELQHDYLCYKVKCTRPPNAIGPLTVTDQFGTRDLAGFKAATLCTPAAKRGPTTTTTTTTTSVTTSTMMMKPCSSATAVQCDGICPQNEVCVEDEQALGTCVCVPATLSCSHPDMPGVPACYGLCTSPNELCVEETGFCTCRPAD